MKSSDTALVRKLPRKPTTSKKKCGFLALPGELRNQIYGYHFKEIYQCVIASKGSIFKKKGPQTIKLCLNIVRANVTVKHEEKSDKSKEWPISIRYSGRLGYYKRIDGTQTNWVTSLCPLILACKTTYQECLPFLYRNTEFVFDASSRIKNFVRVIPQSSLIHITSLDIYYRSYGEPERTKDRIWKEKHGDSWILACEMAARKLLGLRNLKFTIQAHESPLRFDLHEQWVRPCLQFRRLNRKRDKGQKSKKQGLDRVEINLKTTMSSVPPCPVFPQIAVANEEMHKLFAGAIAKAVMGAKESEAMAELEQTWEDKYKDQDFARTLRYMS